MKRDMMIRLFVVALIAGFVTLGCPSNNPPSDPDPVSAEELTFEEIDSEEADWMDPDSTGGPGIRLGKGSGWKEWRQVFKQCMQADFFRKPFYFGPSNAVKIGTLADKRVNNTIFELSDFLTANELELVIKRGGNSSCQSVRTSEIDLDALLEADLKTSSPKLTAALNGAKESNTTVDAYAVDNLLTGELMLALTSDKGNSTRKRAFLDKLRERNVYLINKVIRVSGFKSTIKFEEELSAEAVAAIEAGAKISIGDTKLEFSIERKTEREIEITSESDFVVFGKLMRAKKI